MRILILLYIIILLPVIILAQVNKYGVPIINNYSPQTFNASDQNWSVIQDQRGVMYFGNNDDGLLEFDGINWRKIKYSNSSTVRSLAIDSSGTVFVGGVGGFGYITPDEFGEMKYVSLSERLDSSEQQFQNVWKTYTTKDAVYFCTTVSIFKYDYNKVYKFITLPQSSLFSYYFKGKFYFGNYQRGLMMIDNKDTIVVRGGDFFYRKNIFSILPYSDNEIVIGTMFNGLFIYNLNTGKVSDSKIPESTNNYFRTGNVLSSGSALSNDRYIFGTTTNGVIIVDKNDFTIISKLNTSLGLQSDIVYSTYNEPNCLSPQPLWFAMDKGISKTNINSPFNYFGDESGIEGSINDIIKFNGTLYVATVAGVYYLEYENNDPKFIQIEGISSAWSFLNFKPKSCEKEILLIGTNYGLYEIFDKNQTSQIERSISNLENPTHKFYTYILYASRFDPDMLYIGTSRGFIGLKYKNDKNWEIEIDLEDTLGLEIRSIRENKNKEIWACSAFDGIYKISFDNNKEATIEHFDTSNGLPMLKTNFACDFKEDLIFATEKGFYKYSEIDDEFIKDDIFGDKYCNGSVAVYRFITDTHGNHWLSLSNNNPNKKIRWVEVITPYDDGNYKITDVPFMPLPNLAYEVIYTDNENITWFGNSNGLYSYDKQLDRSYENKYYALIRKVTVNQDSVIFHGTYFNRNKDSIAIANTIQPEELIPTLEFSLRNPIFYFAAPFFENEESTVFSYFLDGYSNSWSKWDKEPKAVYTNLPEGDYTFKVKAKNIYGYESELAEYKFTILPPWYRTIWAYIMYVVIGGFLFWLFISMYTKKLKQDKIRLEKIVTERTAEVVKQKDEIEEQKDKMEEINIELTDSIQYAKRIQRAILPHEDYVNGILSDHFILFKPKDIVSGDFFWLTKIKNLTIVTAADCTGHGVPGAFMSMLGVAFLNEIVKNKSVQSTGQVLDALRGHIIKSLQQTGKEGEQKDGMDIAICTIDDETDKLQFSGANNPLYVIRHSSFGNKLTVKGVETEVILEPVIDLDEYNLFEVKGDKMPVSIHVVMDSFKSFEIQLEKNDTVYIFSDGFADQFGGQKGKKFMYKPFKKLLLSMQNQPMVEQKVVLDKAIEDWKGYEDPISGGTYEQIDDIVIIGIRNI